MEALDFRVIMHDMQALIDLVTVFEAILKSSQTHEKLQCLYEDLMSNNLRKTASFKKHHKIGFPSYNIFSSYLGIFPF